MTPSSTLRTGPRSLYDAPGDMPGGVPGVPSAAAPAAVLSRDASEALLKKVLGYATADETRVSLTSGTRGNTRFAVNQVSTGGDSQDAVVVVQSTFGRRTASAVTNGRSDEALRSVVQRAEALARLAPEDPEQLPALGPQQYQEASAWVDATAALDPVARAATVRAMTEPARAAGLISTGYLEHSAGATAVANSRGLFAYHRQTRALLTTTMRTPDGTGSGWAGVAGSDFAAINARALAERAMEKARRSANPVAVEPGRYTVVLEAAAVASLIQLLQGSLNARLADEGRSFFSKPGGGNKIGQKVVDERVTLVSDPFDPETPGAPFSGDGLPVQKTTWIENGVVKDLAYDRYWAQRNNRQPNGGGGGGFGGGGGGGGGGGALRMSGGTASLEDLIRGTQRGLLVTRFFYIRTVDPRTILHTGLTRDGTFLIENGKITRAVKNFRWNESPVFVLNNLEALGRPERVGGGDGVGGGSLVVPPLRARDFNFTSLSDAV